MSKPPFDRDEQLHFLQNAKDRAESRIARWKKDGVIKDALSRRAFSNSETDVTSKKTEKYSASA